jgi:peptide subunit release factor 1 (eRF1)
MLLDASWLSAEDRSGLESLAATAETGVIALETAVSAMIIVPPFPVEQGRRVEHIDTAPLRELLDRRRSYAAFLLRRGGYTIGFFRGEALVASKTDRRFVKNRHKAGGQSQRRFDRIREKQIHELFGKACEDLTATLTPHEAEIERLYLGGDRQSMIAFRKQCGYLDGTFRGRIASRLLPVASDPRKASLDAVPREIWTSDVYRIFRQNQGAS